MSIDDNFVSTYVYQMATKLAPKLNTDPRSLAQQLTQMANHYCPNNPSEQFDLLRDTVNRMQQQQQQQQQQQPQSRNNDLYAHSPAQSVQFNIAAAETIFASAKNDVMNKIRNHCADNNDETVHSLQYKVPIANGISQNFYFSFAGKQVVHHQRNVMQNINHQTVINQYEIVSGRAEYDNGLCCITDHHWRQQLERTKKLKSLKVINKNDGLVLKERPFTHGKGCIHNPYKNTANFVPDLNLILFFNCLKCVIVHLEQGRTDDENLHRFWMKPWAQQLDATFPEHLYTCHPLRKLIKGKEEITDGIEQEIREATMDINTNFGNDLLVKYGLTPTNNNINNINNNTNNIISDNINVNRRANNNNNNYMFGDVNRVNKKVNVNNNNFNTSMNGSMNGIMSESVNVNNINYKRNMNGFMNETMNGHRNSVNVNNNNNYKRNINECMDGQMSVDNNNNLNTDMNGIMNGYGNDMVNVSNNNNFNILNFGKNVNSNGNMNGYNNTNMNRKNMNRNMKRNMNESMNWNNGFNASGTQFVNPFNGHNNNSWHSFQNNSNNNNGYNYNDIGDEDSDLNHII